MQGDIDAVPTIGSTNAVQSGGVYNAVQVNTNALAGKQDILTFDAAPTSGNAGSVISSSVVYDMFNDHTTASGNQDQYVMRTHESRGKMLLQVWYNWSALSPNPQNFGDVLTALGLDSANFYTYNGWPGGGNAPTAYHATSVPGVVNTETSDFKVDHLALSDHFLVRWTGPSIAWATEHTPSA